ncbi:DUF2115 family protein [Candidatus Methanocrinis natronophilus]|uniref:DUF2115 family protein n=1 Tax=Candidatus Methanocrinis natronophilus TaxID=3033396 RepID=A0ABT5X541_9EURY|nr:DUF2115 family protein [Candidatus Methanocrinis natronophilus]MDF0589768.1 DUF2115 family protein [Candidatus Methanocrinis natronophilus]
MYDSSQVPRWSPRPSSECGWDHEEHVRLWFLKFLLTGFCMLVQGLPTQPARMPFPSGDEVRESGGVYCCLVREKAEDVDSALCPFCPALHTPEIGYLRPPL